MHDCLNSNSNKNVLISIFPQTARQPIWISLFTFKKWMKTPTKEAFFSTHS